MALIGQFVVGFGIGIDFPVSSAYVAEFMPKSERGRMIVATIAFQSVGMLVAAGLAMAGLMILDQVSAWRAFFAIEAVLAGIIFLCRLSLPESVLAFPSVLDDVAGTDDDPPLTSPRNRCATIDRRLPGTVATGPTPPGSAALGATAVPAAAPRRDSRRVAPGASNWSWSTRLPPSTSSPIPPTFVALMDSRGRLRP